MKRVVYYFRRRIIKGQTTHESNIKYKEKVTHVVFKK